MRWHLSTRSFAIALLAGLAIRVGGLLLPGTEDVGTWKIWSYAAAHDLTGMYGVGGDPPVRGLVKWRDAEVTVNYPPVFLYEYAVVGRIYGLFRPEFPDGLALRVAVKLPELFANIGLTWLLFSAVGRISGELGKARWVALAFWLNPATLFGGELLGYIETLFMLPAIAGLVLVYYRRWWLAGAMVALGVWTKPQGLLIGPAFALALWQTGGVQAMAKAGAAFALTTIVSVLPFIIRGAAANMWLAFGSFYERRDTMSAFAANVGWIINWLLRGQLGVNDFGFPAAYLKLVPRPLAITRFIELGYPNPRPFATAAVVAAALWAMWAGRRARGLGPNALVGVFTVHAFFVLNVGVHEHLQLLEVPLLAIAAVLLPQLRPFFFVVSAIVALNINIFYGISPGWGWALPRGITLLDFSVVLSFVNVATLIWLALRMPHEMAVEGPERSGRKVSSAEV